MMESNFTFIKDVLPEAYNIAYGLEQDIIRDIPSSGEDFGQFLELIVNDMLEKKLRKITDRYVLFSERVRKLFNNNPRIISDSFKDKLKHAYGKRSKCVHVDPETNVTFKPPTSFYVKFVREIFYIAVLYYRVVEDEFFEAPDYVPPYKLDRLKYEDLTEEGQHQFDLFIKHMQEGRNPADFMEELFSKPVETSENVISEESKIIETEGLKENIEVSDLECGIIADGAGNITKAETPISLDDFSKFLKAIKISNKEKLLTKCLVCGNETDDSNVCYDCLKKIYFSTTLKRIYRNINDDSFTKEDLVNLGYSESDSNELMNIFNDYSLIKDSSGKFVFNSNDVETFLYLDKVADIEDLFVSYYNEKISSKEISESEFYHLGKAGNKIFNRFYVISSNIKFNRYIKDLTEDVDPEEAQDKNYISNEAIVNWYDERINRFIQSKEESSEENTNFIQKFILITEILMNKWLVFRADNLTNKEINDKLGLSREITNFWLKKASQYKFNEEYEIFDTFSRKKELVDMDLILKSISDDKSREEIANDANVKISDLNNYYEWGMKKIEPYVSFYNEFKYNYVYNRMVMYIDNLKDVLKSSEARLKTKISLEELQDWYNQGKIDFVTADSSTERFINFFFFRTIILSNHWLNLRRDSYSVQEASDEIEVSVEEVYEWLDFGSKNEYENLDGYQLFRNFFINHQEIVIDSIINSLNEGNSLEEAAAKEDLTVEDLDAFYELGRELTDEELDEFDNIFYNGEDEIYSLKSSESDRYPYNKYSEYMDNVYYPQRRAVYLKLLSDGQSKANAARLCALDIEEIDDWYAQGKHGKSEYSDFYNEYLKIKIGNYENNLIKGKSKKDALKSAGLEENEISSHEDEINESLLKKRMDIVLKEIKLGKDITKITRKLKLSQSDIFEWFEKGLNGEADYINFCREYKENYIIPGCEVVSSYFAKGLNKKNAIKRLKKEHRTFTIEDIEYWQSLGLLKDEDYYKDKKSSIDDIIENEEAIEVEEIGVIKELPKELLALSKNSLSLLDYKPQLIVDDDSCAESKVRLNYINLTNSFELTDKFKSIIQENYVEIEYSKRLQSAYLDILHYEGFNDYENIWHWVVKKADNPDFDIETIPKKEISEDKIVKSLIGSVVEEEGLPVSPTGTDSTEEIISDESYSGEESSSKSNPLDILDDYDWEEDELKDDEERKKDYDLVTQFIDELGREEDIFDGFIGAEDEKIESSSFIESSSYVEEPIIEGAGSSSIVEAASTCSNEEFLQSLNQKVKSLFGDKVINKELTKKIKEEYNLPHYVIEFIIDKFSENGIDYESIVKVLKYSFKSLPKPSVFEVVDKVSVKLFYKQDKYIAKFYNLGYNLEIDPSYPFQYEKLLSGDVWAYVKLNNEGKMTIEDLELIEGPYFRVDYIIDKRKEFTKDEWIDLILNSCGINSTSLCFNTKLLLLMRLIPFVEKNFYLCEISDKKSLKDIFYRNISFNNFNVNESLYGLFYNQQKHKKGAISYFDSISINQFANIVDINKKDNMINYMVKKDMTLKDSYSSSSLIFSNDSNEYIIDFIKSSEKSNRLVNSILCDEEFLESIHCIIPSFDNDEFNNLSKKDNMLSEDYGFNNIVLSEYFSKLRALDCTGLYGKYFRLGEGANISDFNSIKLMSSALIKILYPDQIYYKEDIREIIEICIKSRKIIKKILNQDADLSYVDLESSEEIFI